MKVNGEDVFINQPIKLQGPIWSFKDYEIWVGLGNDKNLLPHYLVVHKEYGVVEYETDILYAAQSWVKHFIQEASREPSATTVFTSEGQISLEVDDEEDAVGQNVLPFNKPN